mmetsp:Transcript_46600/g.151258  ORF Transcript_46600/g.151258 Transcript_46600/m.151258 type:complete len:278 (+) Transcript_46600:668-1501(+)
MAGTAETGMSVVGACTCRSRVQPVLAACASTWSITHAQSAGSSSGTRDLKTAPRSARPLPPARHRMLRSAWSGVRISSGCASKPSKEESSVACCGGAFAGAAPERQYAAESPPSVSAAAESISSPGRSAAPARKTRSASAYSSALTSRLPSSSHSFAFFFDFLSASHRCCMAASRAASPTPGSGGPAVPGAPNPRAATAGALGLSFTLPPPFRLDALAASGEAAGSRRSRRSSGRRLALAWAGAPRICNKREAPSRRGRSWRNSGRSVCRSRPAPGV